MKVCPYCDAVNEEKNSIKCCVCGKNIEHELEFSEDELHDEVVQQNIYVNQQKRKSKKRNKIIIITLSIIILLLTPILIYYFSLPKGHIYIKDSLYIVTVGDSFEVEPQLFGDITLEDVMWKIETNTTGDQVPFRYKIEGNKFVFTAYLVDEIKIKFYVKDDGMQKHFNNVIKIAILGKSEGQDNE